MQQNYAADTSVEAPPVLTEIEAAAWLRVSRITLQRIRLRGEISYSRVGGTRVVYTPQNLYDYLSSRERPAIASTRTSNLPQSRATHGSSH